ncbi:hypothetical protein DNI29_04265 [Hymenobacter sediminis]|uniref:BRO family protein n=1 Tax=Hymenobacter sediminis TaxID=2218621 RepID=UPI000DA674FE|nr:BRO family protein [Hymenobacter sediminis]RPD50017.1 hypothetical protein DNI29_04265 [Hymenobacter sediminis]
MKKVQLFCFEGKDIRSLTDENGNPWFVAADVCRILEYKKSTTAVLGLHCRPQGCTKMVLPSAGGKQSTLLINEGNLYRLAAKSEMPQAEVFEAWIFDEVLPSLRKTGTYSLRSQLLPAPRQWEKTFPSEFMKNVLKLYGQKYNPKKGTPQFVGHFINKYVYNCMDKNMTRELKAARAAFAGDDEVAFLHQFLGEPAREALQAHIMSINTLMVASSGKEHFELMFDRVYVHKNQLEMMLK